MKNYESSYELECVLSSVISRHLQVIKDISDEIDENLDLLNRLKYEVKIMEEILESNEDMNL